MPGFVVNGKQYTSGRNVIMGTEMLTLEEAKQLIEELVEENDKFVFKNAELKEELADRTRELILGRRTRELLYESQKGLTRRIAELESKLLETEKGSKLQIAELEKLWYPESKTDWTIAEVVYEFDKWQTELEKVRRRNINKRK